MYDRILYSVLSDRRDDIIQKYYIIYDRVDGESFQVDEHQRGKKKNTTAEREEYAGNSTYVRYTTCRVRHNT